MNEQANVAVRPMCRRDLDAFARWGKHRDPLFRHYDVRALTAAEADDLWRTLAAAPQVRRPFAALAGPDVVGSLLVRPAGPTAAGIGIVLDPARLGQGLGRRILAAMSTVLEGEGIARLSLDVARYNVRAIAAYRAAGFQPVDERWDEPEPGIDIASLLGGPAAAALAPHVRPAPDGRYRLCVVRMERRSGGPLPNESKVES